LVLWGGGEGQRGCWSGGDWLASEKRGEGLGLGEKEKKREKREERFTLVHDMWDQEGVLFSSSSRWSRKE
jgi:hypothetical protein